MLMRALSLVPFFMFFSWWFLSTTPACKCLNHRSEVRPHVQQRRTFHISLLLHPSSLLAPRCVIPRGPTPVFLRCLLDNSIPEHLNWQHNQPEVLTHRLSLCTFSNGTASPPPLSGWKVFSTSLFYFDRGGAPASRWPYGPRPVSLVSFPPWASFLPSNPPIAL